jgi:hypothetical protein
MVIRLFDLSETFAGGKGEREGAPQVWGIEKGRVTLRHSGLALSVS